MSSYKNLMNYNKRYALADTKPGDDVGQAPCKGGKVEWGGRCFKCNDSNYHIVKPAKNTRPYCALNQTNCASTYIKNSSGQCVCPTKKAVISGASPPNCVAGPRYYGGSRQGINYNTGSTVGYWGFCPNINGIQHGIRLADETCGLCPDKQGVTNSICGSCPTSSSGVKQGILTNGTCGYCDTLAAVNGLKQGVSASTLKCGQCATGQGVRTDGYCGPCATGQGVRTDGSCGTCATGQIVSTTGYCQTIPTNDNVVSYIQNYCRQSNGQPGYNLEYPEDNRYTTYSFFPNPSINSSDTRYNSYLDSLEFITPIFFNNPECMDPNYSNPVCDSIFNRTPRLRYYYSVNKLAISNYITNQIPNYKNMLSISIWNLTFIVRYNDSFTMQNIHNNNVFYDIYDIKYKTNQ